MADTDDDLLEQVARQLEARKGAPLAASRPPETDPQVTGEPLAADAPPAAPEAPAEPVAPIAQPSGEPPAAAPSTPAVPDWEAALSPEAREQLERLRSESEEAKRIRNEMDQLRANHNALYHRVAPTQRENEALRRQLEQIQRSGGAAPAAAPVLTMDAWFKRLPKTTQEFYAQYPDDRDAAFEAARAAVESVAAHLRTETEERFAQMRLEAERNQLAAQHPDFQQYVQRWDAQNQRWINPTPQAQDYWGWVERQPEHIRALAVGSTAAENANALTLYKWEKDNPNFHQTLQHPDFQRWAQAMPPRLTEMVLSPNLDERLTVLSYFWRDYNEAIGNTASPTPEANAARQLAARRERQTQSIAPSPRGTPAPASAAAGAFDEDAAVEDVFQRMQARRHRG